jgi:CRP-like cAMP-binding protein
MTLNMDPAQSAPRRVITNRLLALLSPDDFAMILPELEHVHFAVHDVLYEAGDTIEHVYFPTSGCVSMVHATRDGTVEVGTVGFDGMVGIPVLLHGERAGTRALVQIEGEGYRLKVADLRRILEASDATTRVFLRFALAMFNHVSRSVACNRLHSLEERCARWLLIAHDKVEGDHFKLTQEYLSYMLGVHRPAVTLAAGVLQKAGYIRYSRGNITITDRAGLEGASCSCYQLMRDSYEELTS